MKGPLIFALLAPTALAQTNETIVPSEVANREGNAALAAFSGLIPEFQQLFRSSDLANSWSTPVSITGLSFRVNGSSGAFDAVVPRIEIRLSTSEKTPETMVTSYAVNRGADESLVFARNSVALFSADGAGPRAFDLTFNFEQPFTYDPRNGSLLLHFRHEGIASPRAPSIDSEAFPSTTVSPVGFYGDGSSFVRPTGYGAAVEFQWMPIPEPRMTLLFGLGAFIIFVRFVEGQGRCRS